MNKNTNKPIGIYVTLMESYEIYVKGFSTRKGLRIAMNGPPNYDEEVRKIDENWEK